jgi:hypothetical protein
MLRSKQHGSDTASRLIQDKVVKLTARSELAVVSCADRTFQMGPTERLEVLPAEDESQDRDALTESDVDLDPITVSKDPPPVSAF